MDNRTKSWKPLTIQSVCCFGAGHVGGQTRAVVADRCSKIQVKVVDLNRQWVAAWNNPDLSQLPVHKPGLNAIVVVAGGRNLFLSTEVDEGITRADMVSFSVNAQTNIRGIGAGQASNMRWSEAGARWYRDYYQL